MHSVVDVAVVVTMVIVEATVEATVEAEDEGVVVVDVDATERP